MHCHETMSLSPPTSTRIHQDAGWEITLVEPAWLSAKTRVQAAVRPSKCTENWTEKSIGTVTAMSVLLLCY